MFILLHRILVAIPTLFLLPLVIFVLLEIAPGDATLALLDPTAGEEVVEQLRTELRLDRPFVERYLHYIGGVLQGDLGVSARSGIPVATEIALRLPYTLLLMTVSVALALAAGGILGVIGALKRGTVWDMLITALVSIATAIPSFWFALLLISLFALRLRWLPVFGADGLPHLVLPAICTAFALTPGITRLTRSSLLETITADFVVTARAKGLASAYILLRHVARIATVPVIGYVGLQLIHLFTSLVVIEMIFNWPGLGGLAVSAVFDRDFVLLQGTTLAIATLTFAILLVIDVLTLYLDPRVTAQAL